MAPILAVKENQKGVSLAATIDEEIANDSNRFVKGDASMPFGGYKKSAFVWRDNSI
ncbi:hypothetical protein [Pseudomonas viridiflava]|uniref:hypothetical protein n=1 Tax=Pseudomonas viridiflava TaxID=33069 RepID=UPI002A6A6E12|nr:hypothetical protein [Pseudomonas viridiflava]MDY0938324.1 hypothetical protein [Pseudomonas viridiflava]MDY1015399.1 hypothetical protein [Pseudomonas viridiflava]